jgi:UDP-glucuronate decarboxylase
MNKYTPNADKKNILILGGAGFLGSFLCEELVRKHNVICLDNFITGSVENIRLLIQNENFAFIKHDLSEPIDLENQPDLKKFKINIHGIQEIYNLACPTAQKDYKKFIIETILANSAVVRNSLDIASKYQSKYLFASTSSVYGDCHGQEVNEETQCPINYLGPRSSYNEGKRFAEMTVTKYGEVYGFPVKIARIFPIFGPRMISGDARLIPDFIEDALNNKTIEIEGNPPGLISYLYVQDLIDGLVKLMHHPENLIINLSGEQEFALDDIAKKIINLTESKADIKYVSPPEFLTKYGKADINLAKEKLGWFPLISLDEGLKQTIDYFKAYKVLDYKTIN